MRTTARVLTRKGWEQLKSIAEKIGIMDLSFWPEGETPSGHFESAGDQTIVWSPAQAMNIVCWASPSVSGDVSNRVAWHGIICLALAARPDDERVLVKVI